MFTHSFDWLTPVSASEWVEEGQGPSSASAANLYADSAGSVDSQALNRLKSTLVPF